MFLQPILPTHEIEFSRADFFIISPATLEIRLRAPFGEARCKSGVRLCAWFRQKQDVALKRCLSALRAPNASLRLRMRTRQLKLRHFSILSSQYCGFACERIQQLKLRFAPFSDILHCGFVCEHSQRRIRLCLAVVGKSERMA